LVLACDFLPPKIRLSGAGSVTPQSVFDSLGGGFAALAFEPGGFDGDTSV
jgi:hypothetical protein